MSRQTQLLFNGFDLRRKLDARQVQALNGVYQLREEKFIAASDEEVEEYILSKYRVEPIKLDERSEEHSELQSHSFISYAVFCLKKKNTIIKKL